MSRRKTPFQQISGSRRPIARAAYQEKFQHIRHEQFCDRIEKVKAVMKSVLLFTVAH